MHVACRIITDDAGLPPKLEVKLNSFNDGIAALTHHRCILRAIVTWHTEAGCSSGSLGLICSAITAARNQAAMEMFIRLPSHSA